MKFNREITLSLKLNHTGMRMYNGALIKSKIQYTSAQAAGLITAKRFGSFVDEPLDYFQWLKETFKAEISEEINNLLLDELKGHKHSIPRHTAFETWLEGQEITLSGERILNK